MIFQELVLSGAASPGTGAAGPISLHFSCNSCLVEPALELVRRARYSGKRWPSRSAAGANWLDWSRWERRVPWWRWWVPSAMLVLGGIPLI